jgi:hypothetical protein
MGKEPGAVLGPLAANLTGVAAIFGLAWLAFRRQEL